MSDFANITAADLDREIYLAVAGARDDAETDILAGVAHQIVVSRPNVSTAELQGAISGLHQAIIDNRLPRQADIARDSALLMCRLLTRVVPALTNPALRAAVRDYTRAFLNTYRSGASSLRKVLPIDLQFDRFAEVERFRRETWQQLHDLARGNAAVARAIDEGPIGEALGVHTTHDARTALSRVELEPLASFVISHLQPDGSISVTKEEIESTFVSVGTTMTSLTNAYSANLVTLNKAQQDATVDVPGEPTPPRNAFREAISRAEEKQKELDQILKTSAKGAKGALGVLSFAADQLSEGDLATSIDEYATIATKMLDSIRNLADSALTVAKVIEKLGEISADQILLGAAVGFHFAVVAVAIRMIGLFNKPRSSTNVVLDQLSKIRAQIKDLRNEMRVRFDRIEKQLNKIYEGILVRLDAIDFNLGRIDGNVEEMQLALYNLHSELQRLNRNTHQFLDAGFRRPLVEAINGYLGYRERWGQDLTVEQFRAAENIFYSWGRYHAKDVLEAGLTDENRSFEEENLVDELSGYPLETNINYLRCFPERSLGSLPQLALNRLANPLDWIVAGEAYAQLCEESPAQAVPAERVQALIEVGEELGAGLARITADHNLFYRLKDKYLRSLRQLKNQIDAFEQAFRNDPANQLHGINLWGGANQSPMSHFFNTGFTELRRCDGRNFDGSQNSVPVPRSISGFNHSDLRPYMIANNLRRSKIPDVRIGLAALSACVSAAWEVQESRFTGLGNRVEVTYRLFVHVNISYGGTVVFIHRYTTTETMRLLVPKDKFDSGTFDPATDPIGKDPYKLLVGDRNLWSKLDRFPATRRLANSSKLATTAALVERKLIIVQRAFYSEVARRFTMAGDAIQRAGQVLNGWKLAWQMFVSVGLPERAAANEILRSLLFGSQAILGGSDIGGENALLDDVQDLYAFFGSRGANPPTVNFATEISTLAESRANRLYTLLVEIVNNIRRDNDPEPAELFAPTLLRLRFLLPEVQESMADAEQREAVSA